MKTHKTPAKYLPPDWSTNTETDYEVIHAALVDWALWRSEASRYVDSEGNWAVGPLEADGAAQFAIDALDRLTGTRPE